MLQDSPNMYPKGIRVWPFCCLCRARDYTLVYSLCSDSRGLERKMLFHERFQYVLHGLEALRGCRGGYRSRLRRISTRTLDQELRSPEVLPLRFTALACLVGSHWLGLPLRTAGERRAVVFPVLPRGVQPLPASIQSPAASAFLSKL
jgi:hypothetical protein